MSNPDANGHSTEQAGGNESPASKPAELPLPAAATLTTTGAAAATGASSPVPPATTAAPGLPAHLVTPVAFRVGQDLLPPNVPRGSDVAPGSTPQPTEPTAALPAALPAAVLVVSEVSSVPVTASVTASAPASSPPPPSDAATTTSELTQHVSNVQHPSSATSTLVELTSDGPSSSNAQEPPTQLQSHLQSKLVATTQPQPVAPQPPNQTPPPPPPPNIAPNVMQPAAVTSTNANNTVAAAAATTTSAAQQNVGGMVVNKKKGRFKLLGQQQQQQQFAPTEAQQSPASTDGKTAGTTAAPPPLPPPNVQSNCERASSSNSIVSHPGAPWAAPAAAAAPIVKKKGRFMVTSVKEESAPPSGGVSAQVMTGNQQQMEQAPQQLSMNAQMEQAPHQSSIGSAPSPQYQHATMMSVVAQPGHLMQQPVYYTTAPPQHGQSYPQMTTYTLQQQPYMTMAAAATAPVAIAAAYQNQPAADALPPPGVLVAQQQPLSATAVDVMSAEEIMKDKIAKAKILQQQPPLLRKSASVPRSNNAGVGGEAGLGKVFYFLEQMRLEVTEADRTIKSLQSDAKFLREKNKELEAKVREAERKLNEEKGLREAAEGRIKMLRKKLRTVKGENSPVNEAESTKEEECLDINAVGRHTRAESLDFKELVGLDLSPNSPLTDAGAGGDTAELPSTWAGTKSTNGAVKSVALPPVGKAAVGNAPTTTPPRGAAVTQKVQGAAQKTSPTNRVQGSSESAARIKSTIPAMAATGIQRNTSTSSLPAPASALPQASLPGILVNGQAGNGQKDGSASLVSFDPLRPQESMGTMHAMTQTPVFMMNQHTLTVVPASAMEASTNMIQLQHHQQGAPGNQNYQDTQQQHIPGSGSFDDIQRPMFLVQQHQYTGLQQPQMMTIQQPILHVHQQGRGPQEAAGRNYLQTVIDPNHQWTNANTPQQNGHSSMMQSSQHSSQHNLMSSSQPNTSPSSVSEPGASEQKSDPFDELVTRRPQNAQQQHQQQQPI